MLETLIMKSFRFTFLFWMYVFSAATSSSYGIASDVDNGKGYLQYTKELGDLVSKCDASYELLSLNALLLDTHLQSIVGASKKIDASSNLGDMKVNEFYKDIVESKTIGSVMSSITEIVVIHERISKAEYSESDLIKLTSNVELVSSTLNEMDKTKVWGYAKQNVKVAEVSHKLSELWYGLAAQESIVLSDLQEIIDILKIVK